MHISIIQRRTACQIDGEDALRVYVENLATGQIDRVTRESDTAAPDTAAPDTAMAGMPSWVWTAQQLAKRDAIDVASRFTSDRCWRFDSTGLPTLVRGQQPFEWLLVWRVAFVAPTSTED